MKIIEKVKKLFTKTNTLYYPGCITKMVYKNLEKNYQVLFEKAGIDFIQLKDAEKCCGSPVTNAGYDKDYSDLVTHNKKLVESAGVKRIITNCPACYNILKKEYPEIEVEHAVTVLLDAVITKKLKLKRKFDEKITYHDPCHLGRYAGIYEEPRKLLKQLGFTIIEMARNRESSLCCGAGGGLQNNSKSVSERVTKMRLNEARLLKVKKLITACPMCYHQFKKYEDGLKILDISEVLLECI
ncbi:CoB--CoM heterodisulfide reductase iron-sulfur subunit D [Candidatus Tiddalikarchaeum anstoanum]|nr:CoB--CoM heterodisulfide reductase iron-sulfur subunit D [Candidatus Tiddalikarchaeum anstoanum]